MARARGCLVRLGLLGVLVVLGLAIAARRLVWFPDEVEPVAVTCAADAPPAPRDRPLKVLIWNIQFAGSRRHHFFYDGGRAVHVPEEDVRSTLARIAEVLRREDADVVLLQEVDRGATRTHGIDEHAALLEAVPYPCHASTPYHRVGYVPVPTWEPLGEADLHLSIFSRFPLQDARRVALPLLDEPWWRRLFNLRRAVLDARVPLAGGGTLRLLDTHLSAFSQGDGTLERQVAVLDQLASSSETAREPFVLAGDLNALPPGDDAARLPDGLREYPERPSPVERLFRRYASAHPERWRTYLPFGAREPDRTLDYAFVGRTVRVEDVAVLPATDVSDHLPLVVTLTIPSEAP
jgi:endonuclease/exonuclease/phosphatase family metal-dependent hydrolase